MLYRNLEYVSLTKKKQFTKEYLNRLITKLKEDGKLKNDSFNDSIWEFKADHVTGNFIRFNFSTLNLKEDEKILTKTWLLNLVENYSMQTCHNYFITLRKVLNITHCFNNKYLQVFSEWMETDSIRTNEKKHLVNHSLNFINFNNLDVHKDYIQLLLEYKSKLRFQRSSREIPSSKYVLQFSYILEDYLHDIDAKNIKSEYEYKLKFLLYYPLKIWWYLTTIIPMRSVEFNNLSRNCISKTKSGYFVTVKRYKGDNLNQTYEINESIYNMIKFYIDETKQYGRSDTLISFRSLLEVDYNTQRNRQKKDKDTFNENVFRRLILKFYNNVVRSIYDYYIPVEEQVKPNDTRHLAFVSLMIQGVDPVEIAWLGGHSSIRSQLHYSHHTEYWIDNEVFKLLNNITSKNSLNEIYEHSLNHEIKLSAFKKPTSNYRGELTLGYCSDDLQRCESHNCMMCSQWRINRDDLISYKEELLKESQLLRNNLQELIPFISNLNNILIKKEYQDPYHVQSKKKVLINKVDSNINELATLTLMSQIQGDQ